jgi:hypothetical protein
VLGVGVRVTVVVEVAITVVVAVPFAVKIKVEVALTVLVGIVGCDDRGRQAVVPTNNAPRRTIGISLFMDSIPDKADLKSHSWNQQGLLNYLTHPRR